MQIILTIVLSIIGSSAVFSFLQFLITRKDKKDDQFNQILSKMDDMDTRVEDGFSAVDTDMKKLRYDLERTTATTARVRILRASDEISHKMRHSKEWFDQLNDDINYYETYCKDHPEFVNNKAKHAIDNIDGAYSKALKDNDFL